MILIAAVLSGCVLSDYGQEKKPPPTDLIATPVSYYSTPKARYLGTKYKQNLERLAARIVRDPKTASLQFANNISSVGGIGFFTHSATKTPDERYLEVVLATPETFETKGDYSDKVSKLFDRYGLELLSILSGDREIYQDKELSGYGLNLAWRDVIREGAGSRVAMARAVVYVRKEQVSNFLRDRLNANNLLANAVIFAVDDDGPLQLVSYQTHQIKPDYRPAIHEDNLAEAPVSPKAPQPVPSSGRGPETDQRAGQKVEAAKPQPAQVNEKAERAPANIPDTAQSEAAATFAPVTTDDQKAVSLSQEVETSSAQGPLVGQGDTATTKLALEQKAAPAAPSPETATARHAAVEKKEEEIKPEVAVPVIASTITAESNQILQSDESVKARATMSTAAAKLAPDINESQAPTTTVVKDSQEAASAPAPAAVASRSSMSQGTEAKAEDPALSATIENPVRRSSAGKLIGAPPAVAELESPAVKAEQPAEAKVAATQPPRSVEKALPMPVTAVPKQMPQERKSESLQQPPAPASAAKETTAAPVAPPTAKLTEAKTKTVTGEVVPPVATSSEAASSRESAKARSPATVAGNEAASIKRAPPVTAAPVQEKVVEKIAPAQLALLKKPSQSMIEKRALARPMPKPLEGFIIQIAFNNKEKAQNWAEKMEQRGYAVSVTEAGTEGSLRVRLGNFALRDEAERQLKNLKQDGMNGIIINLPQAFRPVARSSVP
ncbi:MAG: SPOR domain-containing protein [Chloroflexota bacterium]